MNDLPVAERIFNVLFLCTGNSARSVIAEALLEVIGAGRFRAFSAGSRPTGQVQPLAAELAAKLGFDSHRLRSKSWDEFDRAGAREIDLIITVCDNAASEVCPVWPGQPATAHWSVPDPAAADGDDAARRRAYLQAFALLRRRVELLTALPADKLDRLGLQRHARGIARVAAQ